MFSRVWTAGLVLALGLLPAAAFAAPAAEKASPEQINKLIQQLGSSDFAEREKATSELEKMGAAALEPLQKAAQGDDAEIARRAKSLVGKVERRAAAERVLQPRRIKLAYKDKPLAEALADFQKQSGYTFQLIDPENKLKDRKVTLDTGETSFWHALDLFCDKAGLTEGTTQDFWQAQQGGRIRIQPIPLPANPPPGAIQKVRPPLPPQPAGPATEPINKNKLKKEQARPAAPATTTTPAVPPQAVPAQPAPPAPPAQVAQVQIQVQVQPGGPIQIMPGGGAVGGGWAVGGIAGPGGQNTTPIYLKDGKAKGQACDDRTAVRVRVFDPGQMFGPAAKDVITLGAEVRPEPRLQLTGIKQVRVDKAVDDQGQTLSTAKEEEAVPGIVPGFPGGGAPGALPPRVIRRGAPMIPAGMGMMGMQTMIRLKAGEKAAKSLKVLKGVATVNVLSDQPSVTVNNVLKAAGKTFKGEHGASIKVVEVKDKDDAVTLRLEVQQPNQGQAVGPVPVPIFVPPPVQVQPVPAPAPGAPGAAPPALPRGAQAAQAGGQGVAQAGKAVAQPGRVVAQPLPPVAAPPVAVPGAPPGAQMPVRPIFREGFMGLTLHDEKGNSLPLNITMQANWAGGQAPVFHYELTWKRQEGKARPSKLVLATKTTIEVDVPFNIENVPLP